MLQKRRRKGNEEEGLVAKEELNTSQANIDGMFR
jgi:hypothetical protein